MISNLLSFFFRSKLFRKEGSGGGGGVSVSDVVFIKSFYSGKFCNKLVSYTRLFTILIFTNSMVSTQLTFIFTGLDICRSGIQ